MSNPLLEDDTLPRFTAIRAEHAEPAIRQLIERNKAQIDALLEQHRQHGEYRWDSVMGVIEALDDELSRAWAPVSHLHAVRSDESLRAAYGSCLPLLAEYSSWCGQHRGLYEAFEAVAKRPDFQALDAARQRAVHNALRDFRLAGVALETAQQQRFAELRQQLSRLGTRFSDNVLDATEAWSLDLGEEDLAGLPAHVCSAARQLAGELGRPGCTLRLDMPTYQAVMSHAQSRWLRESLYTAWCTRASDQGPHAGQWDNTRVIEEILDCRQEMAQLLGFGNYAELSLATKMADSTADVLDFLQQLAQRVRTQARREWQELLDYARQEHGIEHLQAWDVAYYSEQLRQSRFRLSQEEIRPYLPLPGVLRGLFALLKRLYTIDIEPVPVFDTYHPDVTLYRIQREGQPAGWLYLDLHARPGKRSGAWMGDARVRRSRAEGTQLPVAWVVCNFSPPEPGRPCQLSHDELITLFHEFGHALHHLLTRQTVAAVSGINGVEWDAVELPSQFLENWCWEPEALAMVSGHVDSGEPLPRSLLDRLLAARHFQSAMQTVRQLEFALFDFRLHMQWGQADCGTVQSVLDRVRDEVAVLLPPAWNRFQHSFGHIFSGGYAAGYYSYKWAEVLSADAFSRFEEEGVFNPVTGGDFLREVLEVGGSRDAMATFRAFRGREPDIAALLRHSGIAA